MQLKQKRRPDNYCTTFEKSRNKVTKKWTASSSIRPYLKLQLPFSMASRICISLNSYLCNIVSFSNTIGHKSLSSLSKILLCIYLELVLLYYCQLFSSSFELGSYYKETSICNTLWEIWGIWILPPFIIFAAAKHCYANVSHKFSFLKLFKTFKNYTLGLHVGFIM